MPNEPLTINAVRIKSALRILSLLLNHAAFVDNASMVECKKLYCMDCKDEILMPICITRQAKGWGSGEPMKYNGLAR